MKIAIVGYGIDGQAAYRYFASEPSNKLTVLDENPNLKLDPFVKDFCLGPNYLANLTNYDLIIRSSGINPAKIIAHNPSLKTKLTTGINYFVNHCPTKQIIGVTGTKGKGTTSTLIYQLLKNAGYDAYLAGNIGLSPLDIMAKLTPSSYVVLELSSFQLTDFTARVPISVCLMVEADHLNWHGNLTNYLQAKAQLFNHQTNQDICFYLMDSPNTLQVIDKTLAKRAPYHRPLIKTKPAQLVDFGQFQILRSDIKLLGDHNLDNLMAAVQVSEYLNINKNIIQQTISNFRGLAHRLELVRILHHVSYYNDSFASDLYATKAAILAIPGPKLIIVGGFDRQLDLEHFGQFLVDLNDPTIQLLIIGASGQRLIKILKKYNFTNFSDQTKLTTMAEIVKQAQRLASAKTSVVLSPGFASFDMFTNFEDRGNQFKQAVLKLV